MTDDPDKHAAELVDRCLHNIEHYQRFKPGFRRAHARGHGFRGFFVATPEAAQLTTAEHMQGERVETVVRLSSDGVDPYSPDRASEGRGAVVGLAVRFELPSGGHAEWVAISIGRFPPRVPEDFIDFTSAARPALVPGLPDPLRLGTFLARRPSAIGGGAAIATAPAPDSFATAEYHGLNAYYAVDAECGRRAFRYRWTPVQQRRPLTKEDDRILPPQYLISEMKHRIARSPAVWNLVFQMADPEDPVDDMTKLWPDTRPLIHIGQLIVDRVHQDQEEVDASVFDPVNVPTGIEISEDPILRFRSEVYRESKARRAAKGKPAIAPE
jgi:catalase